MQKSQTKENLKNSPSQKCQAGFETKFVKILAHKKLCTKIMYTGVVGKKFEGSVQTTTFNLLRIIE